MKKSARAIIIKDGRLLVMHRNKQGNQYYTLVGGKIEKGETAEQALVREVREETTLQLNQYRLVFIEKPDLRFGTQYIYLAEYNKGKAILPTNSMEARISQQGKNLYRLKWLLLDQLSEYRLLSETLKRTIIKSMKYGFPETPKKLNSFISIGGTNGS